MVTGLTGSGLVLQVNGVTFGVSANGPFRLPLGFPDGTTYNVTVVSNPNGPNQLCTVSGGNGTIHGADVTTVSVTCADSHTVGGTVSGLLGSVTLQLNGAESLSVFSDSAFAFATRLAAGAPYSVTVQSKPSNQLCAVSGGSGTIGSANVDVAVTCATFFTVVGNVSGLQGSGLVLQLNGAENLSVSANGFFTFTTPLLGGAAYNVTVSSNPTHPNQLCTVSGGGGTISNFSPFVSVSCVNAYSIGGSVSGLTGTGLVLRNSCGGALPIPAAGGFTFPAQQAGGTTYGVSVLSQPAGQLCVVTRGAGQVGSADVTDVAVACGVPGFSVTSVSDPLVPQQWHLRNTCQTGFSDTPGVAGMDINADAAYGLFNVTGGGVVVAVVDSGLEIAHEDLAANVVVNGSWNFNNLTTDPTSPATNGDHGTSVAGLIAMAKNTVGGIGVAPSASLKGFNFISSTQTLTGFINSLGASSANPKSDDVFIFNQSFGISTDTPIKVNPTEESQYLAGVTSLRDGKGAIYVKAAGNGFSSFFCIVDTLSCENANFDPGNTLPYQIVVGSVAASGVKASYSTAGSAIWVSAPGGEFGQNNSVSGNTGVAVEPAMVTTDQTGCAAGFSKSGVNTSVFNNGGAPNNSCNYWNGMNGTSSATPVTVGVVALMLEANPALTWRDVKHILASTARQIDPDRGPVLLGTDNGTYAAELPWTVNHASPSPFHYHNWYGFGMVDAAAAVSMAKSYALGQLGTFTNTGFIPSGALLNLAITDSSAVGATSTISVPGGSVQFVEAVQIRVNVLHPRIDQVGIELISPQGTHSLLKNAADGYFFASDFVDQVLLSNAFYGENPVGSWTIKAVDPVGGGQGGTLVNWAIRVYGH